jgi:hypothetical protein
MEGEKQMKKSHSQPALIAERSLTKGRGKKTQRSLPAQMKKPPASLKRSRLRYGFDRTHPPCMYAFMRDRLDFSSTFFSSLADAVVLIPFKGQ